MSNNQYGLDNDYFERKIAILHRDGLRNWRPDELARELARMSRTADKTVMLEPEFETQAELAALREELAANLNIRDRELEIAAEQVDELQQRLAAAKQRNAELDLEWSRTITGRGIITLERDRLKALLRRVIDSSVLSFEADAPEELESLEVDICAALNPTESGASE